MDTRRLTEINIIKTFFKVHLDCHNVLFFTLLKRVKIANRHQYW